MFNKPTASALGRALKCPRSTMLPITELGSSDAARFGTGVHDYLADLLQHGREYALDRLLLTASWRDTCVGVDRGSIVRPGEVVIGVERAYAVGTLGPSRRVRWLGDRIERAYQLEEDEIGGTVDAVLLNDRQQLVVVDFKTGSRKYVDPAHRNAQLLFAALAAFICEGGINIEIDTSGVHVRGVFVWGPGRVYTDEAFITRDQLERFAAQLADLVIHGLNVTSGEEHPPAPVMGEHCRYCPAFRACPAQHQLAMSMAGPGSLPSAEEIAERGELLTPAAVADLITKLDAYDRVAKRLREALEERAAKEPIHFPDGRILGPIETLRETLDPDKAISVVQREIGLGPAQKLVKRSISKSAIEKAVGRKKADAVLDAIREEGGVRQVRKTVVKLYRPGLPSDEEGSDE
jgi:hypothetical protein